MIEFLFNGLEEVEKTIAGYVFRDKLLLIQVQWLFIKKKLGVLIRNISNKPTTGVPRWVGYLTTLGKKKTPKLGFKQ